MSLKDEALKIKSEHPELGYRSIAKILGCAHNTVKFHIESSHREAINKRVARNRSEIRREYKLLAGGKCIKCGYDKYLEVLDFHHRDPSQKLHRLGELFSRRGRKAIEVEMAKCDLLCSNCHREVHIEDKSVGKFQHRE